MKLFVLLATTAFVLTACGGTGDGYSSRASDPYYSGYAGKGGGGGDY